MEKYSDFIPVPEVFWSFETGQPMKRCKLCDCDLMAEGTNYLIEKAFKNGETIFEHALCSECHGKCAAELSLDSRARIATYFEENSDIKGRFTEGMERFGTDPDQWIGHCMVKGYPLHDCGEYQLYGFCIDNDLVFTGAPYMLCGEAIDEILDLLSPETRGAIGEMTDRLFDIDLPKDLLIF